MTHMIYFLDKPKMKVILNQGSQYRTGTNRTDMYTGIETSTFRTSLNTGQFQTIPASTKRTNQYRKKIFFFF